MTNRCQTKSGTRITIPMLFTNTLILPKARMTQTRPMARDAVAVSFLDNNDTKGIGGSIRDGEAFFFLPVVNKLVARQSDL